MLFVNEVMWLQIRVVSSANSLRVKVGAHSIPSHSSFALNSIKNYECFEKLHQTFERVFHSIFKHLKVG